MLGRKPSAFCDKLFDRVVKNCFLGVHGNKLSRKTFRWKPYIFLFRHWAENFHFSPKVFWLGCQNCIPPGNRIILRRSILFEFSPIFFGHWAKNLRDFVECLSTGCQNFLAGLWKLLFTFPMEQFQERGFFDRIACFLIFCGTWVKIFRFCVIFFQEVCQNCIISVPKKHLRKIYSEKVVWFLF